MSNRKKSSKKKKYRFSKQVYLSRGALTSSIVRVMKEKPKARFHPSQLKKKLKLKNNVSQVEQALKKLVKEGVVRRLEENKFIYDRIGMQMEKSVVGYVDMIRSGAAFIMVEGLERDIYVHPKRLGGALNGDQVRVRYQSQGSRRPEGEILEVVKRATENFQGIWRRSKDKVFVDVEHESSQFSVQIHNAQDYPQVKPGDHVMIRIDRWSKNPRSPHHGVIQRTMEDMTQDDIMMSGLLMGEGFDLHFSDATLRETQKIPDTIEVTKEVEGSRQDFRSIPTFTIDPEDAKDFDDALSLQILEDGECIVGIHIADVTHYVKPGTALDEEALERSTSVYLVDRVLPMLPEKLSNNLCSLRPHEDRFSFSAWFKLGRNFEILSRKFGKSIIHSDHRYTYTGAQEVIEGKEGPFAEELRMLNEIAKVYRQKRFDNGALNFETDEIRFRLDDTGEPVSVYVKDRQEAHMLVEEFMLLANREVATYIAGKTTPPVPFVYRVHDLPDEDKLCDVKLFAQEMGLHLQFKNPKQISDSFEKLRRAAQKDPRYKILEPMGIRAMAKAIYSTDNIGHYGLAFEYYTHFTSPIRRYSDVLVHRILQRNLTETNRFDAKKLQTWCGHISRQERKAQKAERESIKYFQTKYMKKHEGEVLTGMINGFIEAGIFVQMTDSKAEGLIGFDKMEESYILEESRLRAIGKKSGTALKVGDLIQVLVQRVDMDRRRIDLDYVADQSNQ